MNCYIVPAVIASAIDFVPDNPHSHGVADGGKTGDKKYRGGDERKYIPQNKHQHPEANQKQPCEQAAFDQRSGNLIRYRL